MEPRPADVDSARTSLLMVATVSGTIRHFLLPYARHFRGLGWHVEAAANGATADPILCETFDAVHELPLSRSLLDVGGLVRGARALSAILDRGPSIVHAHTPIAAFMTRGTVRRMPAPDRPAVAYTAHGFHFHEGGRRLTNAVFLTAERVAGRWTDRLVVINDEDYAAARRHRIVPAGRLLQMPGIGIDTDHWAPVSVAPSDVAAFRDELGVSPGTPLFVILGEFNRNKRQRDVTAALAAMRHTEAHLVLLGRGAGLPALEGAIFELGLQGRVHIPGFLHEVRPAVRAATALILPSAREGLARSIMESLALEVPVIASTARGNAELLASDSGVLVPTGDVAGFAAAMDRLIDHPDEGRAMGQRGRRRMVERYDLRVLLQMHEDLYEGMLAERGTA